MQTQRVGISDDAWVELTQGSLVLLVEGGTSGSFLVHFSNTLDQPAVDAPAHRVQTFQAPLDFAQFGLNAGQRVWARSFVGAAFVVVTREVVVFVNYVPSGSEAYITSAGMVYQSQEAA
jgi:hypothetical protein